MARPNKPWWHEGNQRWACKIAGKRVYFPPEIGQRDRPLIGGVPKAAWDWLEAFKNSRKVATVDPSRLNVAGLAELYLAWAETEVDSGRMTRANLNSTVTHLSRFADFRPREGSALMADRLASSLDPSQLEAFANAMAAEGHAPHYLCNLCKSVQACFNWGTRLVKDRDPERYLLVNPLKGYRPPKPPKSSEKYLEPKSFRAFMRWAWARARTSAGLQRRFDKLFVLMLRFLALSGARPGEACSLQWSHVRWREGYVLLEEWKNAKSTGKFRRIFLTPPVARLLRRIERLEGRSPESVFTHSLGRGQAGLALPSEGMPWNSVAFAKKLRAWRAVAIESGVPIAGDGAGRLVAYLLRHTYISDALMAGMSGDEAADLAGTSASQIEDTYGHIQPDHAGRLAGELARKRRGGRG